MKIIWKQFHQNLWVRNFWAYFDATSLSHNNAYYCLGHVEGFLTLLNIITWQLDFISWWFRKIYELLKVTTLNVHTIGFSLHTTCKKNLHCRALYSRILYKQQWINVSEIDKVPVVCSINTISAPITKEMDICNFARIAWFLVFRWSWVFTKWFWCLKYIYCDKYLTEIRNLPLLDSVYNVKGNFYNFPLQAMIMCHTKHFHLTSEIYFSNEQYEQCSLVYNELWSFFSLVGPITKLASWSSIPQDKAMDLWVIELCSIPYTDRGKWCLDRPMGTLWWKCIGYSIASRFGSHCDSR